MPHQRPCHQWHPKHLHAVQVAGGRSIQALLSAKVALLSAIAGSIAVASCVLNDFFDYSVDVINEPTKVGTLQLSLISLFLPIRMVLQPRGILTVFICTASLPRPGHSTADAFRLSFLSYYVWHCLNQNSVWKHPMQEKSAYTNHLIASCSPPYMQGIHVTMKRDEKH